MKSALKTKLAALEHIYLVYDRYSQDWETACRRFCSRCCTRNLIVTSIEAYKIAEYLENRGESFLIEKLSASADLRRFQPLITTNKMAELCSNGREIPEEESNPQWGPCPLLENDECPVYEVRPFGCRCMVSSQDCNKTGYADMEPFIVTVNNVFLQYIEHIDADGYTGNLTDMLIFMGHLENRSLFEKGVLKTASENLISNHQAGVLMIPPEHQLRIKPILKALQDFDLKK
ncbi:Putative zinc- or iron-chelating domain-containing protein [Desulfonema limicola]|uniref:Zinc- or iron-chelating domain-containing protein n=1 Tax=Desulfonema limicola TaxID=45656 RepID=A0A975B6F7_9BACT|nr:YkgJ family cysteine cluster protein [Desulfonema limicola]QTA79703.1 Putative zinc- or iron-chelating domain-containing protein [Desulfonema limicola]